MTVETTVLEIKRVCSRCGRNWSHKQTRYFNGHFTISEHWISDKKGGHLCQRCYSLHISTKKHNPKLLERRIKFKGKFVFLDKPLRIGVCNWCRAVKGIDCKTTHLHHEQYDENNPSKHTIEICDSCHTKHHHPKTRLLLKNPQAIPKDRRCISCNCDSLFLRNKYGKAFWYKTSEDNFVCISCYYYWKNKH